MAELDLTNIAATSIATPAAGVSAIFVDTADKYPKQRDDSGTLNTLANHGLQDLNVLTNGGFSIQQRVATAATAIPLVSVTTRAGRVADRWAVTVGNVTTPLWTQVDAGSAPETGLLNRYYGQITQNTNAAKFILSQFLAAQDIDHLRGSKVRISVKLKQFVGANANYRLGLLQLTSAGTIDVDPAFITAIGAASVEPTWGTNLAAITPDATPVENGTISGVALTIVSTAAWVRSSAVFTVPTNCKNLVVVLYRDTLGAASDSVGIAEFQMTQGPDLVDWVSLPWELELNRCLRYFCKTFASTTVPVQTAGVDTGEAKGIAGKAGAVANSGAIYWRFPKIMWRTPATITLFNPAAANALIRNLTGAADMGATVSFPQRESSILVIAAGVAATAVGDIIGIHFTADAEFVN